MSKQLGEKVIMILLITILMAITVIVFTMAFIAVKEVFGTQEYGAVIIFPLEPKEPRPLEEVKAELRIKVNQSLEKIQEDYRNAEKFDISSVIPLVKQMTNDNAPVGGYEYHTPTG